MGTTILHRIYDQVVTRRMQRWILWGALSLLSVGCTERSLETRRIPVAIRLYTGIQSRGAVDRFEGTSVCIAQAVSSGKYTECWDGVATGSEIVLVPTRYYPENGNTLYLRGYYPPASMSVDGELTYTLTGKEDLMVSGECSGSLEKPFLPDSGSNLIFSHLLVKLFFVVEIEGMDSPSYRLRELHVAGLAERARVTLRDATVACDGIAAPISLYEVTEGSDGLTFQGGRVELPGALLVQPGTGFKLDIVLAADDDRENDLSYTDCPVEFEEGEGESGRAYRVKIVLPSPDAPDPVQLRITATVVPWESVEVEGDLDLNPKNSTRENQNMN